MTLVAITGILIFAIANLILLFALALMAWMLVDAAKQDKFLWAVFILGLPLVGATVYFFVEKKHDYMKLRKAGETK